VRVVLDTNVLVQSLLAAQGPANTIVGLALIRSFEIFTDERMVEEYEEVLSRTRMGFHRSDVVHLIERIRMVATPIVAAALPGGAKRFPDADDVMFLEVAVSARADALVTTNIRHFPEQLRHGMTVLTPIDFVRRHVRVVS
jgi:uncharacterized protein